MAWTSRLEIIEELRDRLRQVERAHRPAQAPVLSTGTPLDQLLPEKGLECGQLVEWLSDGEGAGAATLALVVAGRLLQRGGVFVVIDGKREFYPPAAAGLGIPPELTVIVRPSCEGDALWALEQSLRCNSVAVALGWMGGLNDRTFRRLQLAAEAGGGIGFLLRPVAFRAQPSWAAVRLLVQALPAALPSPSRRLHVELLHYRGGPSGQAIDLQLNEDGDELQLTTRKTQPAPRRRATGA
jgi:hypothetical protein